MNNMHDVAVAYRHLLLCTLRTNSNVLSEPEHWQFSLLNSSAMLSFNSFPTSQTKDFLQALLRRVFPFH